MDGEKGRGERTGRLNKIVVKEDLDDPTFLTGAGLHEKTPPLLSP